ncbi:MAG: hypothetical protein JNG84_08830, partial [Archangium sp.]|nr:hypothetical protein [Archangium sp.]
ASSLVLGKWLAVSTMSLATLFGTIASFALSALLIRDEALSAEVSFGFPEAGAMMVVLGPFCLLVSALLMLAALFARGFKEAQASTSIIVSAVGLVPSLSMMLSLQDAPWQLLVPSLGQHMVLLRTFRGSPVGWVDFAVPAGVCAVLCTVALWTLVRLLGREAIVYARS